MALLLFGSLLWPTFFMGASLPLLARAVTDRIDRAASAVGALYGFNTLGAATGALVATWMLLPRLGLEGSLRVGAALNVVCALVLLPFAIADFGSLRRELFAYGGIADFGWTGVLRGAEWLATGALPRSEASLWPVASFLSKALFLAAWAGLVLAVRSGRLRLGAERAILATLLAFSSLYGLQSAQYLLWVVPLGLLRPGRPDHSREPMSAGAALHAAAATAGLVGFYLFLAPGTLLPAALEGGAALLAGRLWLGGAAATLAVSCFWLATVVREGWGNGLRAATDASARPSISPSR